MNQTLFNWAKRSYSLPFLSLGLFLSLGAAVILAACSSSDSQSVEIMEIRAEEGSSNMPVCTPDEVVAAPGETIRFSIVNNTSRQLEFIVTDNEGLQKRMETVADESVLGILLGFQIHDGHEDEAGTDPTEDFRYRSLIDAKRVAGPGIRTMLVTFPEVGEGYVFEHFICAYPDSLDLDKGSIVRR